MTSRTLEERILHARAMRPRESQCARKTTLRAYGLTEENFDVMQKNQNYECAICRQKRALHIDHDHNTGRVRGLLCMVCNTGLGKLGDNSAGLRRAIKYLESGH